MVEVLITFAVGLICGVALCARIVSITYNDSNSKKTGMDSES